MIAKGQITILNSEPGEQGASVSTISPMFYLSDSCTSLTGGSWSSTLEYQAGKYVWRKYVYTYSDGKTGESSPILDEYAQCFGTFTTHIGADGIYTGTVAGEIIIGDNFKLNKGTVAGWNVGDYYLTSEEVLYNESNCAYIHQCILSPQQLTYNTIAPQTCFIDQETAKEQLYEYNGTWTENATKVDRNGVRIYYSRFTGTLSAKKYTVKDKLLAEYSSSDIKNSNITINTKGVLHWDTDDFVNKQLTWKQLEPCKIIIGRQIKIWAVGNSYYSSYIPRIHLSGIENSAFYQRDKTRAAKSVVLTLKNISTNTTTTSTVAYSGLDKCIDNLSISTGIIVTVKSFTESDEKMQCTLEVRATNNVDITQSASPYLYVTNNVIRTNSPINTSWMRKKKSNNGYKMWRITTVTQLRKSLLKRERGNEYYDLKSAVDHLVRKSKCRHALIFRFKITRLQRGRYKGGSYTGIFKRGIIK